MLQNYARKNKVGIDTLNIEYLVLPEDYDLTKPPEDGCVIHGLFIEGAMWSQEKQHLVESNAKEIYSAVPHILLKPTQKKSVQPKPEVYECPVYKITSRRGTIESNGYSNIFIISIDLSLGTEYTAKHWIKRGVAMFSQLDD